MTTRIMPHGMKVGAVSLWLLLLLSEKPMYGYELIRKQELSQFFTRLGSALGEKSVSLKELFPNTQQKTFNMTPTDPVTLKFLYAKEDHKLEVHLEFEWQPNSTAKP